MSVRIGNKRVAFTLAALVVGMFGLAYASVPLYRLFCQVTGFGGTPMISSTVPDTILERKITVRFNADVDHNLPWRFHPDQNTLTVRLGERNLAFYKASSAADIATAGTATFNVTPEKAAKYFHKTYCFCFEEQWLSPGQSTYLPVSFYIDPALADDKNMADVHTVTLSYTFFKMKNAGESSTPKTEATPSQAIN